MSSELHDPLNLNISLGGVDSTVPLLKDGEYEVQVQESTIAPNKDKTGLNWNLKLGLTQPAVAVDERHVAPNFPLFMVAACQAKADSTDPEAFKRGLSQIIDALFGTDKSNRPDLSHALVQSAVGKIAKATVYIDEYQGNKNNKVKRLKPRD